MASPSPKQIERALAANDMVAARGMVSEVLREHPNSPKAHLFNAYILEHADHNKAAANEELKQVVRLDHSGDVKGSALFGKVVAEIEAPQPNVRKYVDRQPVPQPVSVAPVSYAQKPSQSGSNTIVYLLIGVGIVTLGFLLYTFWGKPEVVVTHERNTERFYPRNTTVNGVTTRSVIDTEEYVRPVSRVRYNEPSQRYIAPQPVYQAPPVVVQQPQQQGMGMMGTAASVAGGVVAGNMISDMLHSGHHHNRDYDDFGSTAARRRREESSSDSYTPAVPTPVDYEVKESSFSSGRSSSWDDTPSYSSSSSSSSSDSWSSSSSSSSDYSSSSSSSDYSSSSGGSDW